MGIVAFGSVRSCGVTTLALALAATWPNSRRVLLVEADPAGGTLAAASGWPPEPSMVSFAAASRRGLDPEQVWEHCHRLPGGAAALACPVSVDQARSALGMLGAGVGRFSELDADVLVDCGRLDPSLASRGLLDGADRIVLATRPRLADLHALATWTEAHPFDGIRARLVMVGDGPYPDGEISETLGIEIGARLPWDPTAAAALVSVPATARDVRMAPLVRAARSLADHLSADLAGAPHIHAAGEEDAPVGSSVPLRNRVLPAWRTAPAPSSTNGSAPEEVSQ
jgi:hypothetical protein